MAHPPCTRFWFHSAAVFSAAVFVGAFSAKAQIAIVANNATNGQVALGETFVENFNSLPTNGTVAWTNNSTLRGWYANLTRGQVSTGNMVATSITNISAVAAGSVGGSATLNSLAASTATNRALGGTPSAYASGSTEIFSSQSVNVVLRIKNSTGSALTGMKVAYDTVATSTNNKDAVAFAYKVFAAGAGSISANFIETHRYLNTYNGSYDESMRTEYGRRVSSLSAWTCVVKEIAPTASNRTNSYEFALKDIDLNPGEEIWLAWHIAKEDEKNPSTDPITTTAIDNVALSDFTVSRPGAPIITAHPRNLSVATGLLRDAVLSVEAKGAALLSYQWRKDGANIVGATNAAHNLVDVTSAQRGSYDVVVTSGGGSATSLPAKVNTYARATITTNSDVSFSAYSSDVSELKAATGGTLGDLYYPSNLASGTNRVPAMIIVHGGGGNNGDKLDNREIQAAQEFAARGWFVIAINYAMSSSTVQCWPYNLWDAKQAVRWLKQKADAGTYKIDKTKIGVCGFSWGCNLGAMLAMTGPDDDVGVSTESLHVEPPPRGNAYDSYSTAVQCSAVFYGATDLPNYHQMNQFLDYTAWNNRTLYRRASPVRYPNKTAAPMLVAHGTADDDVWPNQTESTFMMQRSLGARLEKYLYVPGGEHSFYLYETSRINSAFPSPIDIRPETIGFFEKYLVETNERPAILTEPVSRSAAAGSSATFTVEAIGTPAPSFQWRKDGMNIVGATNAAYTVASAGSSTSGYYDVSASNSAGTITSAAALLATSGTAVETPVAIDSQPGGQSVSLGQTATFTVAASGTQPITYQWRKGGTNMASATNDALVISGATTNDAGSYDVVCRNFANGVTNSSTSTAATLTVIPSQAAALVDSPELANQFSFASGYAQTFSNMPGTNTSLSNWVQESTLPGWSAYKRQFVTNGSVVTTNYIPPPSISGTSNSVAPTTGNFYSISNSLGYCPSSGAGPGFFVLRVANQSVSNLTGMSLVWDLVNAGKYATNGGKWSNVVSVSYRVTPADSVLDVTNEASYPPSFAGVSNTTLINGWKLVAAFTNKTVPVATDLSNAVSGLEVAPGTEIRIGWNVVKDGGSNTVSAVDNVRLVSLTSGAIGLDKAPEILAAPVNQLVAAGSAVQFKATVEGRPTPQLQWFKNGVPLTEETTDRFGIPEASVGDLATYALVASNSLGVTNTSATLTVADTSRTNVGVFSNNQSVAFDFSTISNSFNYWFNYGLMPGVAAFSITNTNATPFAFSNYANWPGTLNTGTLVLASTTNGLALGGVGSSTKSQMLVFRMANRSAGLIKGFRVNFTPLALTNASTNVNPPNLQGTLAASFKILDAASASDTDPANYPPNFASTNPVTTNGWTSLTNIVSSNVIVPVPTSQSISGVSIQPDQEVWVGFYLAKPNGDTHFLGVKDVSVDQFTVQSLDKPLPVITFTNPGTLTYGQSVALSASSTGGNAPTYSVVSGGGTITNNVLTATIGTGSVVVRASFVETADYSANEADATVSLAKASQTISFTLDPATGAVGDVPRTFSSTASSGLPVSFSSSSPSVASVSGGTLTFVTGGTTTITASQAGDSNYSAATPVDQNLTVSGPATFSLAPGDLAIVACNDGTDAFGVLALVDIPAGATFHVTDYGWLAAGGFGAGSSTEGTVSYTAPSPVSKGTVLKWTSGAGAPWSQTAGFNFAQAGDQLIIFEGTVPSSGVPIADHLIYALQSRNGWSSDATSSGTSAEPTAAHGGNLVSSVTAVTVPGNESGYYSGTLTGTREFILGEIAKVANWTAGAGDFANSLWASSFTVTGKTTPTVSFGATPTIVANGQTIILAATSSSDASVTYSLVSGTGAILSGNQLTAASGTGSVTVRASVAATSSYEAASADLVVTLTKAAQSVSFSPPASLVYNTTTNLAAFVSGGSVSFALVNPADASLLSLVGNTITALSGTGSVQLRASTAGDANYGPSTNTGAVALAKSSAGVTLGNLTQTAGSVTPVSVTTAPLGLPAAPSYNDSSNLPTAPGSYPVSASINDANYAGSASGTLLIYSSFAYEFGAVDPSADADYDGLSALAEYGLGGASGSSDLAKLPVVSKDGSELSIVLDERTNDPQLSIVAQASAEAGFGTAWPDAAVRSVLPDQTGMPSGFARVRYSVPTGSAVKLFMRIRFTLNP
ncbi:MAG: immunoglobulin domain-containing protein [Chthoniobacterales bacterium]|nr:immunoglobulin domain-containing protein [Chthoniobacterales bacterium]